MGPIALQIADAIAGNAPVLGCYTVPAGDIYDLGYVGELNLSETWAAAGTQIGANILSLSDFLGQTDLLGANASASIVSWVEVNIGVPDGIGGIAWSGWQKFMPGTYPGRYANRRVWVEAPNAQVQASLISFKDKCSVPPRIDHYQNLSIPSAGLTITFEPDYLTAPAPFNSGPDAAVFPFVQVTFNNQGGDQLLISALSLSSVTLQILNGGIGVARSGVNVSVEGY